GYVGLVTGACVAGTGHDVICVDVLPERVDAVNQCRPAFHEPGLPELLRRVVGAGKLRATGDVVGSVKTSDITILAVGTPSREGNIDLSFIKAAAESIGQGVRESGGYHVVVVKSTVVPGTTDSVVGPIVEQVSGKKIGEFGLCMNPEFLREGTAVADFEDPDRIIIGQADEHSGQTLAKIYESFDCPKIFTTLRNAEMTKYTSNALLATLVSFSNEIAAICEATPGTDVEQVMDGLHLDRRLNCVVEGKRYSPGILSYLRAGCGFGGSCLPKDVTALHAFGGSKGVKPHLLEAVLAVNRSRPSALISMAESALGDLKDKTVAVLGLAFKPGTDDLRDSPALALIELLHKKKAIVRGYDPFISSLSLNGTAVSVAKSAAEALQGADAAVIASGLPELAGLDWKTLAAGMRRPLVIDGRSTLRRVTLPASVQYRRIGHSNA
ncbi:MAG: UDP-glucose/GDP-mannose dehydrogenase family protein, partial [Acidobacteriaceae bacterium]|nr:UDP-glucose/GDP-mannose dehydrogenase family protein [Acidobacteriaceae bacterium]